MSKDIKNVSTTVSRELSNGEIVWYDSDVLKNVTGQFFQADYWLEQGAITGSAAGRGTTYFFRHESSDFVLRRYRRGGLIGKLLTDQYFFTGLNKTRAWREMNLLIRMKELGLPAPTPVAASVKKSLFYYRADIITKKIPHAQDVHQHLLESEICSDVWQKIGATIAQFHHQQIYHHDLNIHNIMLDDQDKVWLIDFDKCDMRTGEDWKKANLDRLLRSLNKEKANNAGYHFTEHNWRYLLSGYL